MFLVYYDSYIIKINDPYNVDIIISCPYNFYIITNHQI